MVIFRDQIRREIEYRIIYCRPSDETLITPIRRTSRDLKPVYLIGLEVLVIVLLSRCSLDSTKNVIVIPKFKVMELIFPKGTSYGHF
jgi:hypothetical protein